MIEISIPERGDLRIAHLVLDVNGTLALDGNVALGVKPRLARLRPQVQLHALTADTHGKQAKVNTMLGFEATIVTGGAKEKEAYVEKLGASSVVAIGNGFNDAKMLQRAILGIAVIGGEGLAIAILEHADVLTNDINDALDLLLHPNRLLATLRP